MLNPNQQQQQQSAANIKSSFSVTEENRHYLKLFIQTYHNLPILWDTTLRDYTNRDKRAEAYQQLVPIYKYLKRDANLQDVKKKINTLRTNYRKELKIVESARRQGTSYQPRCWTFYELDFLRNAEKFLAIDPNYIKTETPNTPATNSPSPFGLFGETATPQSNFLEISPYGFRMNNGSSPPPNITQLFQKSFGPNSSNSTNAVEQKPQAISDSGNSLNNVTESITNEGNNINTYNQQMSSQATSSTTNSDGGNKRLKMSNNNQFHASPSCNCLSSNYPEEESVTRTWAYKLKRLPRDQRLFAEKFINDILFEAESGTLHRGSMQLNAFEPYVRFEESHVDENTNSTSHDKSQSPQITTNCSPNTIGSTGMQTQSQSQGHENNSSAESGAKQTNLEFNSYN
ncbi:uncharacterized protein LOC133329242 [Musca vetustissima]|uniref:uncharacterized protein LOC133329242 n=1 Tax=Musca vetustissima TaxID=27455 RepID=UPI002AB71E7E|nr:uncharacterized protein LOC133329242 [Musca vetustissima]